MSSFIARLGRLGLAAAITTAVVASSATVASAQSATASTSSTQVARYGAGYLADQITAGGGHLQAFGFPDPSDTAYAVVGLRAAGVGQAASDQAITYLKSQLTDAVEDADGTDNPGTLGYYILAAISTGANPYQFGGTAPRNNLVARLVATAHKTGADIGLFGNADPTYDGAFRQGVALAALKAAGYSAQNKRVVQGIGWLVRQQCSNGLWLSYRADTSVPCPVADPSTFAGPDTNSTALAVEGLAAYSVYAHRATTLASLHAVQSADGGFPYLAAAGQSSDPNSTALVIQALISTGTTVTKFAQGGATPQTALASYQLGCTDAAGDQGAFFYPGDRSANLLATVQAVPAAAGVALSAVKYRSASSAVPHPACASNAPTSSSLSGSSLSSPTGTAQPVSLLSARAAVAPKIAGTAGHCVGSTGVTVTVDFTAFGQGVQTRCAPGQPATGVAALQQAGFTPTGTAQYGLAFICRINSLPSATQQSCTRTPPATASWSYYHANLGATTWTYSTQGASSYKPAQGSIDAWAFGNKAKPSKTPAQIRAGK